MTPPYFDGCISVGYYEGTFSKAIQLFKFHKKTRLAFPLTQLMVSSLKKWSGIDLLIPIPLHPIRLREREFNQSFLLTYHISRLLGLPFSTDHLERVKHTLPQIGLNASARVKNMKGAFGLNRGQELKGKTVLLIDDVLTTGSTVEACARLLKRKGGVKKVFAGTLARARPV
jgi:ComF family protein